MTRVLQVLRDRAASSGRCKDRARVGRFLEPTGSATSGRRSRLRPEDRPGPVRGRLGVVAAAALLAAAATVLPAPPAGAEATLDVRAGVDGRYVPGLPVPVEVSIAADRLFAGDLEVRVRSAFGTHAVSVPVEVPGGSVKTFTVAAPTVSDGSASASVEAELRDGNEQLALGADQLDFVPDLELVGLLPGLARGGAVQATSALAIDAGTASLSAVSPSTLGAGLAALEVYDQLALADGELGRLAEADRRSVLAWVAGGGRLLVDAAPGTVVGGLPDAWHPGPGSFAVAGRGEVQLTSGALARGRWDEVLEPTATRGQVEEGILPNGLVGPIGRPLVASLADDAGFRLPTVRWLLGVLAAYVLLAGPVTYLALRRFRRSSLAWAVVPGLAVAFTLVVTLTGSGFRRDSTAAMASVIEVGPGGAVATSHLLVTSRRGGEVSVELPAGWSSRPSTDVSFGPSDTGAELVTEALPAGTSARARLDPGEFASFSARGPVELDGGLEVEATSGEDGRVTGRVRNTLPHALEQVAVFTGRTAVTGLDRLDAGEAREFTIDLAAEFRFDDPPEWRVWAGSVDRFQGLQIDDGGAVDQALWFRAATDGGFNFRPLGEVLAVGWSRQLDLPVEVGGSGGVSQGRSMVLARAPVRPAGDRMTDVASRRVLVRGGGDAGGFGAFAAPAPFPGAQTSTTSGPPPVPGDVQPPAPVPRGPEARSVFRFVVPDRVGERPVDAARIVLDVPALFTTAEVWTGAGWVPLPRGAGARAEVPLPEGALRNGSVHARVGIPFDQPPPGGRELVLYERPT